MDYGASKVLTFLYPTHYVLGIKFWL